MKIFVVVGRTVAARELLFDVVEGNLASMAIISFVMAVNGTVLDHPNFAVALDDLRLDFATFSFMRSRQSFLP